MKKSEMILLMKKAYAPVADEYMMDSEAYAVLEAMENAGMLPPVNTCKLIDDGKGGVKHSPSERKWDEEDSGN